MPFMNGTIVKQDTLNSLKAKSASTSPSKPTAADNTPPAAAATGLQPNDDLHDNEPRSRPSHLTHITNPSALLRYTPTATTLSSSLPTQATRVHHGPTYHSPDTPDPHPTLIIDSTTYGTSTEKLLRGLCSQDRRVLESAFLWDIKEAEKLAKRARKGDVIDPLRTTYGEWVSEVWRMRMKPRQGAWLMEAEGPYA